MRYLAESLSGGPFALLVISPSEGASLAVATVSFVALAIVARYAFRLRTKNAQLEAEVEDLEQRLAAELEAELSPVVQLENEWMRLRARYNRHGERFVLVILDVGDALRPNAALRSAIAAAVTRALGSSRRVEDSLYQLDARTFGALLSSCNAEGARVFVDRVRSRLSNEPLRDESGTTYIAITAGVAEWSDKCDSLGQLMEAACDDRKSFSDHLRAQLAEEFTGESTVPPLPRLHAS